MQQTKRFHLFSSADLPVIPSHAPSELGHITSSTSTAGSIQVPTLDRHHLQQGLPFSLILRIQSFQPFHHRLGHGPQGPSARRSRWWQGFPLDQREDLSSTIEDLTKLAEATMQQCNNDSFEISSRIQNSYIYIYIFHYMIDFDLGSSTTKF